MSGLAPGRDTATSELDRIADALLLARGLAEKRSEDTVVLLIDMAMLELVHSAAECRQSDAQDEPPAWRNMPAYN